MPYKLTVSILDAGIVARIKEYAKKRGVTVSFIIDNYFRNIVKTIESEESKYNSLPKELDELIGSLDIDEKFRNKSYKELRTEMYEDREKGYQ